MKRFVFFLLFVMTARLCVAIGTVEVVLSYKLDGVQHRSSVVLGVGGETTPTLFNTTTGNAEWKLSDCPTGYDFRFVATESSAYHIGRRVDDTHITIYRPKSGYSDYLDFGETYELATASPLTEVFVSSSHYGGKKTTNMTGEDIWGDSLYHPAIPKDCAILEPSCIGRYLKTTWGASWQVHSEQDWSQTFTPFVVGSYVFLPFFANLVIYKPTTPPAIHRIGGSLVYGDMKDSSGTNLLYGASGMPLYSAKIILDDFSVMTEWVFDKKHNGKTTAWINGVEVCPAHTTSHIIDYVIYADDNWRYDEATNCYQIDFTMQLKNNGGSSGYAVEQRCWMTGYPTYADAPENKRASASVTLGAVSTFRVTINRSTGGEKIELL